MIYLLSKQIAFKLLNFVMYELIVKISRGESKNLSWEGEKI